MGKKKGGAKAAGATPIGAANPSQAPAALSGPIGPQSAAAVRTLHNAREGFSSSSASATSSYLDALLPDEDLEAHFQEASSSALSEALYDEFSWRVRDFSKVSEEYLYSDIFSIGGFKWRLLLYPRGNNNKYKALSVYLCVPDFQNLDPGWSRLAHFTLSVCNQADPSKSHSCDGSNKFRKREHDWGFQSLMELSKLHEAGSGFVMDDSIVLQARVQVVTHVFMPMSLPYRRELLQRHFKCSLRFYFEEYLEEKVEEWEEFWLDNGTDFVGFWVGLSPAQRKALLQISRDTLLRRIRERLFSEKHVDCNLALDALYLAAEKMRETGFSTTAPLQLESSSVPAAGSAPAAASGAVAASGAAATNPAGGVVSSPADPGALSVLVHAGGFVYMTETAEFPALLRDVRRDSLRLVKDCLSVKKAGDSETDEVRLAKLEEIGCRVLHVFAMELVFHECVLSAFREKVARMRQEMLILEEEEELRREEERKAAKKEKKKKKNMEKSVVVSSEAAAEESAPAARVDPVVNTASFDADDEIMETPLVDHLKASIVAANVSAKSVKRKAKTPPPSTGASSASQLPPQIQVLPASAGSVTSVKPVTASSGNDASSDYLSSSSTSSVKHDDAAAISLKQSTFQALKESFLSKPKNAGKKDNSKTKLVTNPSSQNTVHSAGIKVEAAVSALKPPRGRSPPVPVLSEENVKLDPFEDPLRLASCAAFLAQPSYATVFERKALCFDIGHAKCYRWLVPRRSMLLIVDRDADLLRGVFETTGTVIMDPRKDVPSATSAYVPLSPLKKELFPPISLSRVGHLINLSTLSEESPFETLTTSQFSAILQMFSRPSVTQSPSKATPTFDTKDSKAIPNRALPIKQPSSIPSEVSRDSSGRIPSSRSSRESFDPTNAPPVAVDFRQPTFASSASSFQQHGSAQQESQHVAATARPFFLPFQPESGASLGNSSLPAFSRFQPPVAPAALTASSPFNPDASSYSSSRQYVPIEAQQQQQASFGAGSSGGYSPWGGFDQRIFGSNESPELFLGGLRHEFQQGEAVVPPRNDEELAANLFWNGALPSSQYPPGRQSGSRLFGKVDAEHRQSNAMNLSAGIQSLGLQDHVGIHHQRPWAPMGHALSSGFGGVDDLTSNTFTISSEQQWHNPSSENLDVRGKSIPKL